MVPRTALRFEVEVPAGLREGMGARVERNEVLDVAHVPNTDSAVRPLVLYRRELDQPLAMQPVSTLGERHCRGRASREPLLLKLALSVSVSLPFALRCSLAIHGDAVGSRFQSALDGAGEPFDFRLASLGHVAPTLVQL